MKFHITFLVLLIASNLRAWFSDVLVQASQAPRSEAETAAQSAGVGSKLPGLPVRTSKGEKDMKHPKMVYGHNEDLAKFAPITIRPANYSAHFSKESGQCQVTHSDMSSKHFFLHCFGYFALREHPVYGT